ncbi:NAD(P)-binding protein [Xylariaceae sp. FL1272]|nr:NAD(P)-binding protein [Xylariaceae sp. FL1272]
MVGSRDLEPRTGSYGQVFFHNQFRATPKWPPPGTDLSGKTAIITGANIGLGYEAAIQLLDLKLSHLVIGARSLQRGNDAAAIMQKRHPQARIDVWEVDMSSYDSVRAFARRIDSELDRIDMVLLNAGLTRDKFSVVPSTGHQETIQVNYLSTVLLALLLLPTLKQKRPPNGEPAHMSIVNAALSLRASLPNSKADPLLPSFDDPSTFDPIEHYCLSKLLMHMFMWKLVEYVSANDVVVNLSDPAWCRGSNLHRDREGALKKAGMKMFGLLGRTPRLGASCFIDALVNKGKESHGTFIMSWEIHPFASMLYTPEGHAITEKLWKETLDELDFAGVRSILDAVKGSKQ